MSHYWNFERWLPAFEAIGELAKLNSIWLQFIWLAVGSTVTTRDLVVLMNNSIPAAPITHPSSDDHSRKLRKDVLTVDR